MCHVTMTRQMLRRGEAAAANVEIGGPRMHARTRTHLLSLKYFFRVNTQGREKRFIFVERAAARREERFSQVDNRKRLSLSLLLKMKAIMSAAVSCPPSLSLSLPPSDPNVHKRHFSRPFPGHDY